MLKWSSTHILISSESFIFENSIFLPSHSSTLLSPCSLTARTPITTISLNGPASEKSDFVITLDSGVSLQALTQSISWLVVTRRSVLGEAGTLPERSHGSRPVSYTHLRAHETDSY